MQGQTLDPIEKVERMKNSSGLRRAALGLLVFAWLTVGSAMAQSEPTLNQVYATAQEGKLDQAQLMIQQVLVGHPQSAKAHFVRAELFARQGKLENALESLATADRLSPGLAFAKPAAVQALRGQLAVKSPRQTAPDRGAAAAPATAPARQSIGAAAPTAPAVSSSPSWLMPLLLVAGVLTAGYFVLRRRVAQPTAQQPDYATPSSDLSGPQSFGMGGAGVGAMQPAYPQQGAYAQSPQGTGTGMGGRIMGGVATGLAVGAGVMAAQAIGRTLMGDHNTTGSQLDNGSRTDHQPIADSNPDMGGTDFGVNDASSWDEGGGSDGGGDWDN
jgi:hypothetical protein